MATKTKAPKAKAGKRAPRECGCGCGEMTKGGTYRPGHDARAHAALKAAGKKVTHLLPEEKRAAHAERVRAKRAARRAVGDAEADARAARAAEHEQMDADGVTPLAKAPKVTVRRRKGAQDQEAVAS